MTGIIINGAGGRMGRAVAEFIAARKDCFVCAGMDVNPEQNGQFLIFAPGEYEGDADVIIDCSSSEGTQVLLAYALRRKLALVIMTTGHTQQQLDLIEEASKSIPIFKSGNMSLGINVMSSLIKRAAAILGDSFDVEIVEAHHNKKIDAPSGTALMLAKSVSEGLDETPMYVYDRHLRREPRSREEIGIHSIRGGTIVGEHAVIFAGEDEVLTVSHSASSRRMFAGGAVSAAIYLTGKKNGLYSMDDMIGGI